MIFMERLLKIKRPLTKKTKDLQMSQFQRSRNLMVGEYARELTALKLAKLAGKLKRLAKDYIALMEKVAREQDYSRRQQYRPTLDSMLNNLNSVINEENELLLNEDNLRHLTDQWGNDYLSHPYNHNILFEEPGDNTD